MQNISWLAVHEFVVIDVYTIYISIYIFTIYKYLLGCVVRGFWY